MGQFQLFLAGIGMSDSIGTKSAFKMELGWTGSSFIQISNVYPYRVLSGSNRALTKNH